MSVTRIALIGIGKIARDQHVPTIAASEDFELVAAVTGHEPPEGVPGFRSIGEMIRAVPDVDAVSICTPPRGRLSLIAEALAHGLDVMIEKPPAATLCEAKAFAALRAAGESDVDLTPFRHVADAFLLGRRTTTIAFED